MTVYNETRGVLLWRVCVSSCLTESENILMPGGSPLLLPMQAWACTGFDGGFEVEEAIRGPDRVQTGNL